MTLSLLGYFVYLMRQYDDVASLLNDIETQTHFSQRVNDLYGKNILRFDMKYQGLCKLV